MLIKNSRILLHWQMLGFFHPTTKHQKKMTHFDLESPPLQADQSPQSEQPKAGPVTNRSQGWSTPNYHRNLWFARKKVGKHRKNHWKPRIFLVKTPWFFPVHVCFLHEAPPLRCFFRFWSPNFPTSPSQPTDSPRVPLWPKKKRSPRSYSSVPCFLAQEGTPKPPKNTTKLKPR